MLVTARPLFVAFSLPLTVAAGTFPRAFAQGGPSDGATPPEERVLNQLSAARSTGIGGAFTSSPDGSVLFLAEGGSLGVIDDTFSDDWSSLTKSVPIGSEWLVPTAMALDPDATEPYDESDAEDRLYIAAGRMGLWVMEADQAETHLDLAVARIDDAPGTSPADQSSRRWCSDVDFVTVDGVDYLLALFSEKDASRLRIYKLADARGVLNANPGEETGNELAPWKNLVLARHPSLAAFSQSEPSRSYAYGMAVDTISSDEAHVYVAMGEHGLVRLHLTEANLTNPLIWPVPDTQWGPVFGDGTPYASSDDLYDNVHYVGFELLSQECEERGEDRPIFVDVAVQNDGPTEHFLYAAVDTLGWVRFDVSGIGLPAGAWDADLAIDHHEGVETAFAACGGASGDDLVTLVSIGGAKKAYARRMSIVEKDETTWLLVTTHGRPIASFPQQRNEGAVLTWDVRYINGLGDYGAEDPSSAPYTLLYDLSNLGTSLTANPVHVWQAGGEHVYAFPVQSSTPGEIDLFVGSQAAPSTFGEDEDLNPPLTSALADNSTSLQRVEYGLPIAYSLETRANADRVGRFAHSVGAFHDKPELLVIAFSDGGINADGPTALCNGSTEFQVADPEPPGSEEGTFGLFFNTDAQWPYSDTEDCPNGGAYVWGGNQTKWRLGQFCFGTAVCPFDGSGDPDNPHEVDFWRLIGSPDTLLHAGHGYFAGTVDVQYDLEHDQAANGWKIAFANRNSAVGGLIVVRRDFVEAHANAHAGADDFELFVTDAGNAEITTLITHGEYEKVTVQTGGTNFLGRNKSGIKGSCATWSPETFQLASQSEGERDTWVMAVPCGSVYYPEAVRDRFPQWGDPPSPYDVKDAKLTVRFWNIQDPDLLQSTAHDPFAEILGPENAPNSHAIMCRAIEDQDRVLLFVADHGGRVLVYDVTDYLHTPPADPQPLYTWTAPLSLTDEQPNTIRSIAVDHQVWTQGEATYNRIYVYAGIQRTGIQILRFAWKTSSPGDEELVPLQLVQTPGYTNWVHLRDTPGAENVLLVSDGVGLRAYGYDF